MRLEILTVDTPNKNNRVYPRHVAENAINRARERIAGGQFFITFQPPQTGTVPLMDAAGIIRDIGIEGDNVVAEIETLDNYNGILLKEGLESGRMSVRTSGIGTVRTNEVGINVVENDYEILCGFATDDPA